MKKFDKAAYIAKMKTPVNKLVNYFTKQGVEFSATDGDLQNVIFTKNGKQIKISHHSFYRYSGIATIYKVEGNFTIPITVTDEMYMEDFMKPIVETLLKTL